MKKVWNTTRQFLLLSAMTLVVFSCSKDDKDSVEQETELSTAEVKTVLEIDKVSSAADTIVSELFNGSKSGKTAKDNVCYQTEYFDTGFSVAFDNCSLEENGEILNGSLSVIYGSDAESFAYAITFDNLMVGEIALDGTRSFAINVKQDNSIVFDITSDMSITMTDDEIISEKGNKIFTIVAGDSILTLDGDWTVKANGNTYTVAISQLLETGFNCGYVSKGLMLLNKNGLEVSIDFGDGSCDDLAELAYPDGTKENISLKE